MEYLTLNNGAQMPRVGFGTFMLNGEICINSVIFAIQNGYRMIDTAEAYGNEKEVGEGIKASSIDRSWMDKKQVAHMAYAPLGQGNRNEMYQEPVVLSLAEKYEKTPAQILLRFLTQKGIAVIPRSTQPEHIKENFNLLDFALTADEMTKLCALDKKEPLIGKPETPELVEFSLTW